MSEDEIIGNINEVLFEDWQIKLMKKLREWFPKEEKKDNHWKKLARILRGKYSWVPDWSEFEI